MAIRRDNEITLNSTKEDLNMKSCFQSPFTTGSQYIAAFGNTIFPPIFTSPNRDKEHHLREEYQQILSVTGQ